MKHVWIVAIAATAILSACGTYRQDPKNGVVTFPLGECSTKVVLAAKGILENYDPTQKESKELTFSDSWVCRTETSNRIERTSSETEEEWQKRRLQEQALRNEKEDHLRETLEKPFIRTESGRPRLGIALSGGGTKAAAFGTGVLAGLDDLGVLDTSDYISTVSGGGYAAYFYFTHKILPLTRTEYKEFRKIPTSGDLYRDCLIIPPKGEAIESLRDRIRKVGGCEKGRLLAWEGGEIKIDNRYQAFLRCQQDVFKPGHCASGTTTEEWGVQGEAVIASILTIPPAFIATTLFDWGYTISPAARTYQDGIGIAYGSTISDLKKLASAENKDVYHIYPCTPSDDGFALDCTENLLNPDPKEFEFHELRKGMLNAKMSGNPIPFWIMNAAAPKERSIFGWLSKADTATNADIFEMTAVSHGSPRYGYVSAPPALYKMSVLDSVSTSAAFMDPNNLVVPDVVRGAASTGMHLAAMAWGQDIPNFNTGNARRMFHRLLPVPFNWIDSFYSRNVKDIRENEEKVDRARSVYIRLMDGGNAENLGAFSLFKRKVQNIVISEAAADADGNFSDICGLARQVAAAPDNTVGKQLYIPGLDDLEKHCQQNKDEWLFGYKRSYDIHQWKFDNPVLVGCLRGTIPKDISKPCHELQIEPANNGSPPEGGFDTRLFIVKPAVNHDFFLKNQIIYEMGNKKLVDCAIRGEGPLNYTPGLINCDSAYYMMSDWRDKDFNCQRFPQHGTATMTIDSDENLFSAYRELARQYINSSSIATLMHGNAQAQRKSFERDAEQQYAQRIYSSSKRDCDPQKNVEVCSPAQKERLRKARAGTTARDKYLTTILQWRQNCI